MLISSEGVKPDPEKGKNLREVTPPKSKDDLISFLCMAGSNSDFIPFIARETPNLRQLTTKGAKFVWTNIHQEEFENLKRSLHEDACLSFFDTSKATFLFVDAHRDGLCAVLCQSDGLDKLKTVAISSRATTATEKRYLQIDLEAMAIGH